MFILTENSCKLLYIQEAVSLKLQVPSALQILTFCDNIFICDYACDHCDDDLWPLRFEPTDMKLHIGCL